ncbi:hypothetical protein [Inmirania thermothiophila]|uniref:Uncharacterized protein n=1 Tax=Inmirania thermothiophila TaxID=1750597 RepID=A0A3N1YC78_9GAMM|nr:hypothetical protein [Inmirania thermothiophila]ROR34987.1 hypothetical protein EDC57_0903 [Inmirania thermothiophila]
MSAPDEHDPFGGAVAIAIPTEELLDWHSPITVRGVEITREQLQDAMRDLFHNAIRCGAPPVRFAERWCEAHGVRINRALLEWLVVELICQIGERHYVGRPLQIVPGCGGGRLN